MKPFTILIGGGSASGKTTIANYLQSKLTPLATTISLDNYYKDLSRIPKRQRTHVNFDHPESIEIELLLYHLSQLQQNIPIQIPTYDFATHTRKQTTITITPHKILILEGLHSLCYKGLRDISQLKIFVELEDDLRLIRRIQRDISERKRKLPQIIDQYLNTVRPMHTQFIEPTKQFADLIVPGNQLDKSIQQILSHPYLQEFLTDK